MPCDAASGADFEHISARYEALMSQSVDATIFTDAAGTIQAASRSIRRVLGHDPSSMAGRSLHSLIPPERAAGHPFDLAARARSGDASPLVECAVSRADGREVMLAVHVHAFQVREETCYAVHLADARRMVKKALAAMERARGMVAAADRARDLFIATMSHELRTPLHGLIATLDMLRPEECTQPQFQQRLTIARVSARALLKIANDILDLTRFNLGSFALERRPFSMGTVLDEIVEEFRARADSLSLKIEARRSQGLPPAFISDPVRLKQIIANLVSNALKFTRRGGVSLDVRYDGRLVEIDVADTGEGVPEDKREAIFDPFVQVDSSEVQKAGGTGLGLPISRRLAEAMGGSLVLVRSGPEGSLFRLSLPLEASAEPAPEEQSQRIFANPRGRILVVEDNPVNRYVAEALLGSLECPATIVESGEEAIEVLGRESFDLILMDCQMPGLDGYETTRQARAMLDRHVPIIAITANAMNEDRQRCLDAGMDDFLPKPFGRPALHEMLCKWLRPASRPAAAASPPVDPEVLPNLEEKVFQELGESLAWRTEPLQRICAAFMSTAQGLFLLLDGTAAPDLPALRKHLHTVIGSGGMVGARRVAHLARQMQECQRANRLDELPAMAEPLRAAVRQFEEEFLCRISESAHDSCAAGAA